MAVTDGRAPRLGAGGTLLALSVMLVALNLRAPVVGVSAVVERISTDLGLSAAAAGLLTSLPVLCFAAASPPASWLIARAGLERAVLVGLAVLAAGTVVRSLDGVAAAMGGTVLIGAGITVGNVAVPVVIGRDFPHRTGRMLGAYTATMNVGSVATLAVTVPLADGIGWRWALAAWTALAGVAAVVWWAATRHRAAAGPAAAADAAARPGWWRRPVVVALLVAFGAHAFTYYGATAWLPEILASLRGLEASAASSASSVFQVAALVGAVGVPALRAWTGSLNAAFAVAAAAWLAFPIGLLAAPAAWPVWCAVGGVAQGGGFTAIIGAVIARARDPAENRRMSALVQGGGYAVAATGPSVLGAVNDVTGGWSAPLLVLVGSALVLAIAGMIGTRGVGSG